MQDNSAVFHRNVLDDEGRKAFMQTAPDCPWIFDTDDEGQSFFLTENDACAAQRAYRLRHNFNPWTGEQT